MVRKLSLLSGPFHIENLKIFQKYKQYNARVEQKGNDTLIKSIVDNLGRMLQRKIDAVRVSYEETKIIFLNFSTIPLTLNIN